MKTRCSAAYRETSRAQVNVQRPRNLIASDTALKAETPDIVKPNIYEFSIGGVDDQQAVGCHSDKYKTKSRDEPLQKQADYKEANVALPPIPRNILAVSLRSHLAA